MRRNKDEPPAVRVYTVCDESRYLIVKNVPALGCGDDLLKLFQSYGDIQDCKPMDEEDCAPFTDVYWIKFAQVSNARVAKRKLDEFVFLGNKLQVSYAPHFESLSDTKEKLECRRREVVSRLSTGKSKGYTTRNQPQSFDSLRVQPLSQASSKATQIGSKREYVEPEQAYGKEEPPMTGVSSNKDYFSSPSMNKTVNLVREKLDKIQSSTNDLEAGLASKKARVDNRRRI